MSVTSQSTAPLDFFYSAANKQLPKRPTFSAFTFFHSPLLTKKSGGITTFPIGMFVDIEIDLSTRNGNTRVFITVILTLSSPVFINTETVINRDRFSTWLQLENHQEKNPNLPDLLKWSARCFKQPVRRFKVVKTSGRCFKN